MRGTLRSTLLARRVRDTGAHAEGPAARMRSGAWVEGAPRRNARQAGRGAAAWRARPAAAALQPSMAPPPEPWVPMGRAPRERRKNSGTLPHGRQEGMRPRGGLQRTQCLLQTPNAATVCRAPRRGVGSVGGRRVKLCPICGRRRGLPRGLSVPPRLSSTWFVPRVHTKSTPCCLANSVPAHEQAHVGPMA
eukprot:364100-Chlamydomonas_euryale.AAC.42